jgi:hypothetical protein
MQFEGAVVREQGQTFGIVVVKQQVLHNTTDQATMRQLGVRAFGSVPIVLMAQDGQGVPSYLGRPDIVRFLANLLVDQIPWKRYSLN